VCYEVNLKLLNLPFKQTDRIVSPVWQKVIQNSKLSNKNNHNNGNELNTFLILYCKSDCCLDFWGKTCSDT